MFLEYENCFFYIHSNKNIKKLKLYEKTKIYVLT